MKWFRKKVVEPEDKLKIIGVTMSWSGRPCLCFVGGYILPYDVERVLYPQYFENGDWPTDPTTKEKLLIAKV